MSQLPWNVGSRERANYHIKYSQNFIKSDDFARRLINFIPTLPERPIIELASGSGALTKHLLNKTNHLVAIEKDAAIFATLKNNFINKNNIELINQDLFNYRFSHSEDYTVVGNIPFAFTADIIRLLLNLGNPPQEIYLLMQLEAAQRLAGEVKENLFSLTYKPWFEIKILSIVEKINFKPEPSVNGAWVCITKRDPPLIVSREIYLDFIAYCFTNTTNGFYSCLRKLFSHYQLKLIAKELNIHQLISEVSFIDWLQLFEIYLQYNYKNIGNQILGSYKKLINQQSRLEKRYRNSNTKT